MQMKKKHWETHNELDNLVRRLNRAAFFVPLSRHFLGRIHRLKDRHKGWKKIILTNEVSKDLELWKRFLKLVQSGTSIKLFLERRPNAIFITDSCEHAIGGFSMKTGRAFCFELPEHLRF